MKSGVVPVRSIGSTSAPWCKNHNSRVWSPTRARRCSRDHPTCFRVKRSTDLKQRKPWTFAPVLLSLLASWLQHLYLRSWTGASLTTGRVASLLQEQLKHRNELVSLPSQCRHMVLKFLGSWQKIRSERNNNLDEASAIATKDTGHCSLDTNMCSVVCFIRRRV